MSDGKKLPKVVAVRLKMRKLSLAEKTRIYWHLSKQYNGHSVKPPVTTEYALHALTGIANYTNPGRSLVGRVKSLLTETIVNSK